ncbi:MAG TPA: PEP/pyruvate-binding domain-containing protein [candidate division Zixibacteria bacterium]|nr:PEP/pyruvate-binding domain-containing protein [candidate division Zixibacteria bacterium]
MSNHRNGRRKSVDKILHQLQERAKELNCLYRVEEALRDFGQGTEQLCVAILKAIPPGWQYPEVCVARIVLNGEVYTTPTFTETPWGQHADITVGGSKVGRVSVFYLREMPLWDDGPFLKEETRLINTIADRLGNRLMHRKMRGIIEKWEQRPKDDHNTDTTEWQIVLQMLKHTDRPLYTRVCRRMLNQMCWSGIDEADRILHSLAPDTQELEQTMLEDPNQPFEKRQVGYSLDICDNIFKVASEHIPHEEIFYLIQKWMQEDKLSFLVHVVNRNLSLAEVADAIRRYHYLSEQDPDIQSPNKRGVEVSLIRRFLSDQLPYISVAKNFIEISDFYHLLNRVMFSQDSHGKLGGKSAGLFLASQILKKEATNNKLLEGVRIPKTYHITSDVLLHFMHHNNFDEVVEQKYKPIDQVRFEYPHVVQTFKNATFPAEIVNGLSAALDDLGDGPVIVRSSSLLEDRIGAAFSGKYKSLFVANQGSKQQRLEALQDAIAEVYASTFGPDPIEYRAERGLIDFGEEMGIMIEEVVGTRVGKYYLPSYAGVAFSRNEFRWSPRIEREDGLIRLVPGMGTRAVDRLSDDYPVLIAPGQPGLRANTSPDEIARYSPHEIDVIDLDNNCFETISFKEFLDEGGRELPGIKNMVSIYDDNHLRMPSGLGLSGDEKDLVVTFDGLIRHTDFVPKCKAILETLEAKLGMPVDIEFASDGENLYLLQCRSQSYSAMSAPAPIPQNIPIDHIVFSANKFISNGRTPDITHIVYVDPQKYSELSDRSTLLEIGRAVGRLNKLLPKRQFALMGPGRWGSRGDIKLGVSVTYSDINNTAALIEIARRRGNYVPDLSFGTHFFQDLVEADIRYLPLYPDEKNIIFNERLLLGADNVLPELLPEFSHLKDVLHVIDIPASCQGDVMRILLNADLNEGLAILTRASQEIDACPSPSAEAAPTTSEHFWRWRLLMAERIAASMDRAKFGVENLYVLGSTKNASAGPASDIDLLVHFKGTPSQLLALQNWLEGWSLCLGESNYLTTGYETGGLLDVHIITDEDIEKHTSWAVKIGAPTDAAKLLPLK